MDSSKAAKLPTGKVPGPEDVAEANLYLMKDHNVTGTVVTTNGGWFLV
jgi:NAD(P)-dependent dehydrogenase (short-subunit alcohol dehydrogenase family)